MCFLSTFFLGGQSLTVPFEFEVSMRRLPFDKTKWVRSSVKVVGPYDRSRLTVAPLSC